MQPLRSRRDVSPTRRWVSIDQVLAAVDAARDTQPPLRPRPRPVTPASDAECRRLNPPKWESFREVGLK